MPHARGVLFSHSDTSYLSPYLLSHSLTCGHAFPRFDTSCVRSSSRDSATAWGTRIVESDWIGRTGGAKEPSSRLPIFVSVALSLSRARACRQKNKSDILFLRQKSNRPRPTLLHYTQSATIMMSRKYMILAALVVAAACAHAGEGPKVTHKVRPCCGFHSFV